MSDYLKRCWAVVNLDNIALNVEEIKKRLLKRCMLMAVVKADAYGHGSNYVSRKLADVGADWFGVSNLEEAISLRKHGISRPILTFGRTPPEYAGLLNEYNITQTIHSAEYGEELHRAAAATGIKLDIHIKVDSGMSRLGFIIDDSNLGISEKEIVKISGFTNFNAQGIYTHFACADESGEDSIAYTKMQFERFTAFIKKLEAVGVVFNLKHCCNSAATVMFPNMHMDMVRPGIILYGLAPDPSVAEKISLKPVMEVKCADSMVKYIPAGTSVSYGRTYVTKTEIKAATVPIGYADGFGRELSNKARMLVNGQFARVVGRVCMDQLVLDVSHIDKVSAGDIVTIIGRDGGKSLTFDEMAALSGTINYEKACLIGKRVPRVYLNGGEEIGVSDYYGGLSALY